MLEPEPDDEIQSSPHINTAWRYLSTLAPRSDDGFGLTFANLSTQPQPGRGGIAVMLAIRTLRGSGTVDHGGREGALIRHALIAVNRGLGQTTLAAAAESLIRHSIGLSNLRLNATEERRDGPVDEWYHKYRQSKDWNTAERKQFLLKYLQSFYTLPEIQEPRLDYQYAGSKPLRQLVYIEHDKLLTSFDLIAYASYLASALHLSSIPDCPWAAVQVGTQFTEPDQGLTIRFVMENTLRDEPGHRIHFRELPLLSARDGRQRLHELMSELFGLSVEPLTEPRVLRLSNPKPSVTDTPTMEVPLPTVVPMVTPSEGVGGETRVISPPGPSLSQPEDATVYNNPHLTVAIEAMTRTPTPRKPLPRIPADPLRTGRMPLLGNSDEDDKTSPDKIPRVDLDVDSAAGREPAYPLVALTAQPNRRILKLLGIGLCSIAVGLPLVLASTQVQRTSTNLEVLLKEVRACSCKTALNCPPSATGPAALPASAVSIAHGTPTRDPVTASAEPVSSATGAASHLVRIEASRRQLQKSDGQPARTGAKEVGKPKNSQPAKPPIPYEHNKIPEVLEDTVVKNATKPPVGSR